MTDSTRNGDGSLKRHWAMLGCSESDGDLGKTDPTMKWFCGIGVVNAGAWQR